MNDMQRSTSLRLITGVLRQASPASAFTACANVQASRRPPHHPTATRHLRPPIAVMILRVVMALGAVASSESSP